MEAFESIARMYTKELALSRKKFDLEMEKITPKEKIEKL